MTLYYILRGEEMLAKNKTVLFVMFYMTLIVLVMSGCMKSTDTQGVRLEAANADERFIDEESIIGTVSELASEKYGGRLAGTEGNEAAAKYIAESFKSIGLSNPKGLKNYMQLYPQTVITLKEIPELSIIDDMGKTIKEFKYIENFTLRSLSSETNNIDIIAPLHMITNPGELSPENKDLRGKLLLIPWRIRESMSFYRIVELVNSCGAAGALGEYDIVSPRRTHGSLTVTPMLGPWLDVEHSPFVNVENNTFKELTSAFEKGERVSYKCSFTREDNKMVPNIVGFMEGTDEKLKDQYIIVGAHFDHVGQNLDGSFNPGGLDNASGVASMLEVARVLKENKAAPGKSILFIAFNGEEGGLLGSEYYANNPVYPMDNSVMICMDMVGSSNKLPIMVIRAEGGRPNLQAELYNYCQELKIDARKQMSNGSDHESFAAKGVEAVLLINEDFYNGYHGPEDTAEDVDKGRIEEITKLVLYYIDKNAY